MIIVGHSMGGLATLYASGLRNRYGAVRDSLGAVITIGTPYEGSLLAALNTATLIASIGTPLGTALLAVEALCSFAGQRDPRGPHCSFVGLPLTEAGRAMQPVVGRLGELPRWPEALPVHALATEIEAQITSPARATLLSVKIGDVVASAASATAGGQNAESFTDACVVPLHFQLLAHDCFHVNQAKNPRLAREVLKLVNNVVRGSSRPDFTRFVGVRAGSHRQVEIDADGNATYLIDRPCYQFPDSCEHGGGQLNAVVKLTRVAGSTAFGTVQSVTSTRMEGGPYRLPKTGDAILFTPLNDDVLVVTILGEEITVCESASTLAASCPG
jgi:hypothetical protein